MSGDHASGAERGLTYTHLASEEPDGEHVLIRGKVARSQEHAWILPETAFEVMFYATGAPIEIGVGTWPRTGEVRTQYRSYAGRRLPQLAVNVEEVYAPSPLGTLVEPERTVEPRPPSQPEPPAPAPPPSRAVVRDRRGTGAATRVVARDHRGGDAPSGGTSSGTARDHRTVVRDHRDATDVVVDPGGVVGDGGGSSGGWVIARMRRPNLGLGLDVGGMVLDPQPPWPPLPPSSGNVRHTPCTVELFAPGGALAGRWELPEETTWSYRKLEWPQGLPSPDAPTSRKGWWRAVVRPHGDVPVEVSISAIGRLTRARVQTKVIPKRLLERVFKMALDALTPKITASGGSLSISLGEDLAKLYDVDLFYYTKDVSPASLDVRLRSLALNVVSSNEPLDELRRIEAEAKTAFERATGNDRLVRQAIYNAAKKNREDYDQAVSPEDITIRFEVAFQESAKVEAYGLDVAEIGEVGRLYLTFDQRLTRITPLCFNPVRYTLVGELAELFGLTPIDDEDIAPKVEELFTIPAHKEMICGYFREFLGRAVANRGRVTRGKHTANGWQVSYYVDVPKPVPGEIPVGIGGVGGVGGLDFELPTDVVIDGGTAPPSDGGGSDPQPPPPPPEDTRGTWPEEFVVAGGDALRRLDRIQSIVFIMMENRSFDQMFGDYPRVRPRPNNPVDGLPVGASNPPAGGLREDIPAVPARRIGLNTAVWTSPHHHYAHVQFQMGGGTAETASSGEMRGFTRDIVDRTDAPQLAMAYYQENDLPTYYRMADELMLADRWFCAHPGPTWPNRWATILGSIPELDNFAVDDPRFGFLKERTIFEVLDEHGIDWRVFESDVTLVRMFDRYRLDDRKVVPLDDEEDGLAATLRRPTLPRVMFIEPNFVDTPPLSAASDDHPPADIAHGQEFVAKVCNLLWQSAHWQNILFVVTYDEHGGFYDHVAPPGTPMGPPEWRDRIAKLHPDGATWLGPRVPTLIGSAYVGAGSVTHEVLDHLAVLKTILVHNRQRFHPHVFTSFGPRVNTSPHLGQVLELDTPRPAPLPFEERRRSRGAGTVMARETGGASGGAGKVDDSEFHLALRDAFKPRR